MHPVIFYLLSVAGFTISTGIGLYVINQQYSRQNMYPEVHKAACDHRNYKIFTLPNQIHVMLITSNRTEISAIALKEETGYMNDPQDFQGMSNYIQQLLQASQKYPQPEQLRRTIQLFAGKQIRILNEHESIYYAQVQNDAFFNVIDILSRLFMDPLFTKQSMDKVLQNIHQQWKSREFYDFTQQLISKSRHPYSQFYVGNLKTLFEIPENNGKNPYIEAKKFYRAKYSANRLSIVIYTHEDLKKRVTELLFEYFQDCVDKQLQKITYKQFGLPLKNQRFFYIQNPVKELRIIFDFEIENNHLTKSLEFVIMMLMKNFEKNFCDEVIEKRFAFKCTYSLREIPKEFAIFKINLQLPQNTKIDQILQLLYSRVNLLKSLDNLEQYWNDLLEAQEINFEFSNNDIESIINLSSNLKQYFSKEILQNKFLKKYDKQAINEVLFQLEPQNATIIFMDNFYKSYNDDKGYLKFGESYIQQATCTGEKKKVYKGKVKQRYRVYEIDEENDDQSDEDSFQPEEEFFFEPDDVIQTQQDYDFEKGYVIPDSDAFSFHQLFGLRYFEAGITQSSISKLLAAKDQSLKIVGNSGNPTNFDVIPQIADTQIQKKKKKNFVYPQLLSTNSQGNLWHAQDTSANVPKVSFRVISRFLDLESTNENYIAKMLIELNFQIPTQFKSASIQFETDLGQVEIKVQCFSEHLNEISKEVMKNFENAFIIKKDDFEWYLENLKYQRSYWEKNSTTVEKAIFYAKQILSNGQGHKERDYNVKFETIQGIMKKLFENKRYDVLFYGNIDAETAKSLYQNILQKQSSQSKLFYQEETYKLSKKAITFRLAKLETESIITLNLYQGSDPSLIQYVYMRLLQRLMKFYVEDHLFNQLQLGYLVDVSLVTINHIDSLVILVQSSTYDPEEIDFYIEESLGYFETFLNKLPEKEFDTFKQSISKLYSQIPNTLEQQADIIWNPIKDGTYYFTQRECTILALEKISKQDLIKFFLIFFKARNSKLSLQLFKKDSQIPLEVLREQDTFAHKTSDLVLNQEQFQEAIKDTYKFRSKYIEQPPQHIC